MKGKRMEAVVEGHRLSMGELMGELMEEPAPPFKSAGTRWAGFRMEEGRFAPFGSIPTSFATCANIIVIHSGFCSLKYRTGLKYWEHHTRPGSICVTPQECEYSAFEWRGNLDGIAVELDAEHLRQLIPGCDGKFVPRLLPQNGISDVTLASLVEIMRMEVESGCCSGTLYAESLSLAFLEYAAKLFAANGWRPRKNKTLSPSERILLTDYIHSHLDQNIALVDLASLLKCTSPELVQLFKNTFHTAPYRLVMLERMNVCRKLLLAGDLSIAEVAAATGFVDQSHLTRVFRKYVGVTPREYRQLCRQR